MTQYIAYGALLAVGFHIGSKIAQRTIKK